MRTSEKVAYAGVLAALAMIFSYIEYIFPLNFGIPGVKLGLANLVTIVALYIASAPLALALTFCRILLSAMLFGSAMSLMYSLAGGILSFTVMVLLKKTKRFSPVGVSVAGGVMHNVGQLAVAMIVLENFSIAVYLPVLLLSGALTGALLGAVAIPVVKSLKGKIEAKGN